MNVDSSRAYTASHPWLTFRLDLRELGAESWMLLGEARSKVEHISRSLLSPDVALRLHQVYLAKGVLATTAIEGNTLSEEDALRLVEGTLQLPPSQQYLAQEMDNVIRAFNEIRDRLMAAKLGPLSIVDIKDYNAVLLEGLDLEEGVVPGEIRDYSVGVARYRAPPPADCEYLVDRLCDWLNGRDFDAPSEATRLPYAILKAILAHLYLAWIHPFGDGNGRTARLVELRILLGAGVATPATHLLSNHYNQTRTAYYLELDRSSRSTDGPLSFVRYAVAGFVDGLRGQLEHVREQQFADRWEQYVYQRLGNRHGEAHARRRRLALELARAGAPVPKAQLRHLTPELAEAYAQKTEKTLSRDLTALRELDLIELTPDGYQDRRRILLSLLPLSPIPIDERARPPSSS
jgi:Fic family protein